MSLEFLCPVCQHGGGVVLQTYRANEAAQHHVRKQTDPARHQALAAHIRTLWRGDECRVVRCLNCGFCHAQPYMAGDATFYALAFDRTSYPAGKWEFDVTREVIARLQRENQLRDFHLLELGAGDGAFLNRIVPDLTAPDHVLATEFSEYGIRRIEQQGVTCLAVDVRDLSLADYGSRFNVVCLFQVLEHMDRLDALFAQLNALTASDAHLFIAVPNETKIAFNEAHGSLRDMPPNHIGRWTRQSFAVIAARNSWQLVEHRRESEGFLSKAVRHLKYVRERRAQDPGSIANRLDRISSGRWRNPAIAAAIMLTAWRMLPALWYLAGAKDMGDSQWVWLRKQ